MKRHSRRAFLGALGATGAMLGLPTEGRATAGALSDSGRPLRLVCIYTPHGRAHELWQPRPGFDITYPDASLLPFDDPGSYGRSFKQELLVLDGIDLSAGIEVGTTGHDAPRVILTGSGADGKNASIEQYLAYEQGLGADTPHSTLTMGVGNDGTELGTNVSWARGGTPIPKWIDPARTFDELFGSALGNRRGEMERERRIGKSVLDAVRGDLRRLSAQAPAAERVKLEQHGQALRDIEKRLAGVPQSCAVPPPPDRALFPKLRGGGGGEPHFDAITDLQVDLLARALACDVTRFATLLLADLSRTGLYPELPADMHSDVAHRYDARRGAHPGNPDSWRPLALQNRYSYSKVARLLQRLDESGILHDTIVYVSSDMGDTAAHSSRSVPTLIAGGTGGRFRMGRYLDLKAGEKPGVPNNRILVSICQAFGVKTERFGHAVDPGIVRGRLDELYA